MNKDKSPAGFRREIHAWSMRWCDNCLTEWTVTSQEIMNIKGLPALLMKYEKDVGIKSVWLSRFKGAQESNWKPFLDAVLRKDIHIDFDTAVAKDQYLRQLSRALNAVHQPITVLRQALRRDLVKIAQDLSISNSYNGISAKLARLTFAKPTELSRFLFPPRLLYEEKMFYPYDPDEEWSSDPTMALKSAAEVRRKIRDANWKEQKTRDMLDVLFHPRQFGASVTTFLRAADQHHIRRISKIVSADATINVLNKRFPTPESPFVKTPTYIGTAGDPILCHLDVLLSKLFIYRNDFTCLPQLTPDGLKVAKEVYFMKLAKETCAVCPHNGLLALPRGLKGFVRHYRESHSSKYWNSHLWCIIG